MQAMPGRRTQLCTHQTSDDGLFPPLQGVSLTALSAPAELIVVAECLRSHLAALGAKVSPPMLDETGTDLVACIGDDVSQVEIRMLGSIDGIQLSQALVEAATGITAWHRRSVGHYSPLGVDYLSALSASLLSTGAVSALIGNRRGLIIRHVEMHFIQSGLLLMQQYLAMNRAGQKINVAKDSTDRSPPFVSQDDIIFELEALDPNCWKDFWDSIGLERSVSAETWPIFMARYTQACCFLPVSLFESIKRFKYRDLVKISEQSGVFICQVKDRRQQTFDDDFQRWLLHGPWRIRAIETQEQTDSPPNNVPNDVLFSPLNDLLIIESCRLIQGPLAGHLLSHLGATVQKIEPPGGDPMRAMAPLINETSAHFLAINSRKKTCEVDIREKSGRDYLLDLCEKADVFLHNWAPGRAEKMQLTASDFHKKNKRIVYASASGTGRSPLPTDPIATDFMIQAFSGVAAAIGKVGNGSGSLLTIIDVIGGAAAAEAITAALYAAKNGVTCIDVDSAMAGAAAQIPLHSEEIRSCHFHKSTINPILVKTSNGHVLVDGCNRDKFFDIDNGLIKIDPAELRDNESSSGWINGQSTLDSSALIEKLYVHGLASAPLLNSATEVESHLWMKRFLYTDTELFSPLSPWSFRD
ncbi:TPA: CoA transferase [Pseudomonas aeruginosa]|nr:CoA transferase [Pseudomonas aeruginosa]HEP8786150.1 CoA transferase [Pseudomonas aeruginosa]